MSDRKKVSVVILGWNGQKFLEQFLPSVIKHSSHSEYEIVYADNASTDKSVEFVKANFPTVKIIQNKINNGFAGGYNEALRQVNAEYFVLLNQDVEVTSGWIDAIIQKLDANHIYAAAMPKMLQFHNKKYFEYAGAAGGYLDFLGYPFCKGRLFEEMEEDCGQYNEDADIFWASGACLFVRSDVFWQAGGLDEDFFAHQEEIDLCWRILNLDYKIRYIANSTIYHVGGGSLPQGNPKKTYLNFRNNLRMLCKNMKKSELAWKLPLRFFLNFLAAVYSIIKNRNFLDAQAIFKAHAIFLTEIPTTLTKRNLIRYSSDFKSLYPKSIIWQYFMRGKKKFSELF